MATISIEEKAQRYDDALERAKDFIKGEVHYALRKGENIMCWVFPELKKSDDERICKQLIAFLKQCKAVYGDGFKQFELDIDDALAWLEKQGSVDEDEIVKGIRRGVAISLMNHIDANSKGMCLSNMECEDIENAIVNEDWNKVYGYMKKKLEKQGEQKPIGFNIGDEITVNGQICKVVAVEQNPADKVEPRFHEGEWITNGDYTWKIVEVKPLDYILQSQDGNIVDDTISHVDEQFHSFTIEDAKDGDVLVYGDNPDSHHVEVIMIFKSLRNEQSVFTHFHIFDNKFRTDDWCDCGKSVHPATQEQRNTLMKAMADAGYTFDFEKKELKEIEQNLAWSEEGEKILNLIIARLRSHPNVEAEEYDKDYHWLKSLKERVGNFDDGYKVGFSAAKHNQWKPSDEQMNALREAVIEMGKSVSCCSIEEFHGIESLYDDLKKLMEE